MALCELRVSGLAVFAEASLQFEGGFSALTGETGAGKSVCIAALRVALGGRADLDMIRPGCESASVAAVFDDVPDQVRSRLATLGVPDDELLTLSRHLPRTGRAGSRVNGALVSQAVARDIGEQLVDVTAQGASHRLQRRAVQRDLLDAAAGESASIARNALAAAVSGWLDAVTRLDAARRAAASSEAELTRARDTVAELAPLGLTETEEQQLAVECSRLRNATAIVAAAEQIAGAAGADEQGAADVLARAALQASGAAGIDTGLRELAAAAADLVERLRDLHLDALRLAAEVVLDPARLALVEERLDAFARVKRRYGSVAGAVAALGAAEALIAAHASGQGGVAGLEAAAESARTRAGEAAAALRDIRRRAVAPLERAVTQQLRRLALPHARFKVVMGFTPDPSGVTVDGLVLRCSAAGVDEVEFRVAANRDALPMPLDEGPSGGELSRLALALSAVVNVEQGPALVLDEVDTGIGGETAAAVGDALAQIGRSRQVVAVTHRAEIAARAGDHLCVVKRQQPGGAVAGVESLRGDDRLHEVARLMSGRSTPAALARARELLHEGAPAAAAAGGA